MTAVHVVTAGRGDTYRTERLYLDPDQLRVRAGLSGIAQSNQSRSRNGRPVPARRLRRALTGGRSGGRVPASKCRALLRHTGDGERRDDFAINQECWTGDALPDAKVVHRELARVPKVEVVGLSEEKVEDTFSTRLPRSGPTWPEVTGNDLRYFLLWMERNWHGDSTLPPW